MSENVCLSGGAIGADVLWGAAAALHGHRVIHFTFEGHGHKSSAPSSTLHYFTPEELAVANPHCARANKTLDRRWPLSNTFVSNLLRRNYYQVAWSDAVYAISTFKDGLVAGGTAWAVQMYLDRFDHEQELPCYVYDQIKKTWTQWDGGGFLEIEKPPSPSGTWAGIGTREINRAGVLAIEGVWLE
jgi:hypothetical protein